jgi:hypothetical protein
MNIGRAGKTLPGLAMLFALGGCATGEPVALLSAAELDAMIRVEIQLLEPDMSEENAVAALQP